MPMPTGFDPNRLLNNTIGGYQLQELLGTGNAPVYRAFDSRKGEYVAFKLLAWPGAPLDETMLRRFKREIDLLRKRRHSAIIDIYDWHTSGEYVYLAMECCDGTLERWLQGFGHSKPKLTEVLAIAEPLAAALDFLHEGSPPVLHRDIKPANLLFKGPHWYISDFGIARLEADQLATNDGVLLGTLRYAAPEQLLGGKLGPATDIYSFGLVVFEMLAGGWVLEPRRDGAAYPIPPLSRFRKGLGPAVDDLFRRWLAPDPRDRPARAADAVRELAAAAGVLRDPALARLYDLAADLAARPRDPAAWLQAGDLLAALALHEPAFRDPRGLAAELQRRQAGESPGPAPPGFTGAHPADFYSERTMTALTPLSALLDGAGELDGDGGEDTDGDPPPAPDSDALPVRRKASGGRASALRLRPPADLGTAPFAPRSRYEAEALLVVPRDTRLAGAVFGRQVALEAGARVDGDVYSLGDLTLGAGAEIGGAALAVGTLQAARDVQIAGPVTAGDVDLGRGARIGGWVVATGALATARDVTAAGVLAAGPLSLAAPAALGAPAVGSSAATVTLPAPVQIGGLAAGADGVHPWAANGPGPVRGQALTGLLTSGGRALAEAALAASDQPAGLAAARPVATADPARFAAAPAGERPTLYLPTALQPDPRCPPTGLPADPAAWEGPLAAAGMLDSVWREFAGQLRIPALCAALLTGICWGATLWLAFTDQAAAGAWLLVLWAGVLVVAAALIWALRPRPLELVRLWWAWETWSVDGGVLVWDTLDPGSGPGYVAPAAPLDPAVDQAAAAADLAADDTTVLAALTDLTAGLTELPWHTRPGVFTPHTPEDAPGLSPAHELLHLAVEVPAAEILPHLSVLLPRYDPTVVRTGAASLAHWPATAADARTVWRTVETDLHAVAPHLDRWEAQAVHALEGMSVAGIGLAAAGERAVTLAGAALGMLEQEIAPDIDRLWSLHVEGTKLLGAYYEQNRSRLQAQASRETERAGARAAAAARELRRQETALAEIEHELTPLAGRWTDLTVAHERLGSDLRRAWKAARSVADRPVAAEERFVTPRALSAGQAGGMVPGLAQETGRLATQIDELAKDCAREERDLPGDLPWPAWPARITQPLAVDADVAALTALARRIRNEPTRARERLDRLGSLRDRTRYTLERALGARDALAEALTADPEGSAGRVVSLKDQAERVVAALDAQLDDLVRLARRLEAATVGYDDVTDALASALKGGRNATTWEQGRQLQAAYARLGEEQTATHAAAETARAALAAAQDEVTAIQAAAAAAQDQSVAAETGLLAYSEAQAQTEEAGLRRHVADLHTRHQTLPTVLAAHRVALTALAAFADNCCDLKIRAADQLCDRAGMLTALAAGRIADTTEARAAALWPAGSWPADDMRYLLPVWLLRYHPLGRRDPRLLAVTPGLIAAATRPARFSPAAGIQLRPHPALAARFAADGLTDANRRPGLAQPLPGTNLLGTPSLLLARWRDLAATGLVAPWIGRLISRKK